MGLSFEFQEQMRAVEESVERKRSDTHDLTNLVEWSKFAASRKTVLEVLTILNNRYRRAMAEKEERLRHLCWTPVTERMPTVEDANDCHDVEWSDGVERWDNQFTNPNIGNRKATHWRRITLP